MWLFEAGQFPETRLGNLMVVASYADGWPMGCGTSPSIRMTLVRGIFKSLPVRGRPASLLGMTAKLPPILPVARRAFHEGQ
ncbi:MAG: hypothetical protein DMG32_16220 [Acidobacteria bacterium]|nr:MAG: hypothetical protein DMG32_16220 [Acidobacteriota bacterium]